jgi:hypothetical protein
MKVNEAKKNKFFVPTWQEMQNEEFSSVKSDFGEPSTSSDFGEFSRAVESLSRVVKSAAQFLLVAALLRRAFCAFFANINLSNCP